MSGAGENRLNGWKAIAGYFQRDRTTVMRWVKERGLPVHRIPGGKIGGIFAIREELDEWRTRFDENADLAAPPSEQPVSAPGAVASEPEGPRRRRHWILPVLLGLGLAGTAGWWAMTGDDATQAERPAANAMPADPRLASLYVEARDLWARRTAQSLDQSVEKLRYLTEQDPDFTPGQAALAEALLLAGEFGSMPYDEAMREARRVIDSALERDPNLAPANRADGFVAYWWEREPARSHRAFQRAIAADPGNAQTHFWYANVLSDNGDHAAALAEFDKARLLEPGSVPITTDYAWALWSAGREQEARELLERLATTTETAVIHDSLSHIALEAGDYRSYARHLEAYARLRRDPDSVELSRAVQAALPRGSAAVVHVVLADALQDVGSGKAPDRVWAAFVASLANDRVQLMAILEAATRRKEVWGGSGFASRIAARWRDDEEVMGLLGRLRAPSMIAS